jgi:tetratricopeptide (TPR) repeat protein
MKKFVLMSLIALLTLPAMAQSKYGADSVKCVQNLSLYRDYYKQKMYDEAYKFWNIAYNICPASSERMYVDGANLVEMQLKKAETDEQKAAWVDSLLKVYDKRIENFGKEGYILGRKGTDMLRYANDDIEAVYNTLKKSIDLQGDESEAGAIVAFMNTVVLMEKNEKLTKADVVANFSKLSDILAYNFQKYEGQKTKTYYERAQESVEKLAGPYLNCDVLIKMANDNYEQNKSDRGWMERTVNLLDNKNCTDATIFFTIAKKMHDDKPSAVSAEKLGILSLKNKKYNSAASYFKQAIDLAKEGADLYNYYMELVETYIGMSSYAEARTYARKASDVRPKAGMPYLKIGDMIASSASQCKTDDACASKAVYWLAVDYFSKAKSVDPSIAETANQRIGTYSAYFPEKNDCFFKSIKAGDSVKIGCWINESTKARF